MDHFLRHPEASASACPGAEKGSPQGTEPVATELKAAPSPEPGPFSPLTVTEPCSAQTLTPLHAQTPTRALWCPQEDFFLGSTFRCRFLLHRSNHLNHLARLRGAGHSRPAAAGSITCSGDCYPHPPPGAGTSPSHLLVLSPALHRSLMTLSKLFQPTEVLNR